MLLKELSTEDTPLVGIEPSAILTFRDEYPEMVDKYLKDEARKLGANAYMLEEFICKEFEKGNIKSNEFTSDTKTDKAAWALSAKSYSFNCSH